MDLKQFYNMCWKHYQVLVSDFMNISKYIALDKNNEECYSIEFLKQYQSICSEVDIICELYCEIINPNNPRKDILDYAHTILSYDCTIVNAEVSCEGFTLSPWKDWKCDHTDFQNKCNKNNKSPTWWSLHNKVKHDRLKNDKNGKPYFKQANLKNTIDSLAALFVLEMNIYKYLAVKEGESITKPFDESNFFIYKDWEAHITFDRRGLVIIDF